MAKRAVVVAVQGTDFSLANIYSGGATLNNTTVADLMTAVTNGPNTTCFIYNGSVNTSSKFGQNARAY